MSDPRLARVASLLEREGLAAAMSAAGVAGDILVLQAPWDHLERFRALTGSLKTFGFKYVTLEFEDERCDS